MKSFPPEFKFGFSTVGVQHELGTPGSEFVSDWILWLLDKENIVAGLVSGDSPYNGPGYWSLYKTDHDIADKIGMNSAWITIEWARLFPKPTTEVNIPVENDKEDNIIAVKIDNEHIKKLENYVDKNAVAHYKEILSDWKSRRKFLIINMFHWSLPVWLHDPIKVRKLGPDRAPSGWLDKRTIIEFVKFVSYITNAFEDYADMWYTMNEPSVIATGGYLDVKSGFPPGYLDFNAFNNVRRNLAEAHARAYDAIKTFSRKPVGIVESIASYTPLTEKDEEAAKMGFEQNTWLLNSVITGKVDNLIRDDMKGKLDWIGLNYYTRIVTVKDENIGFKPVSGYGYLCSPGSVSPEKRPCSDFGWEIYPEGLYDVATKLYEKFKLPIYITENGIADETDRLRPKFLVSHLYQALKAISEGVDIRGYFHWNLIDNLEWSSGFKLRFGLVYVDYLTKRRYLRPSSLVFREIIQSNGIPEYLQHLTSPPKIM